MSLILEALRKSEAERRRGQVPELFDAPVVQPVPAIAPAAGAAKRIPPRTLAAGTGAVLVLALGLGWSMRDEPAPDIASATGATAGNPGTDFDTGSGAGADSSTIESPGMRALHHPATSQRAAPPAAQVAAAPAATAAASPTPPAAAPAVSGLDAASPTPAAATPAAPTPTPTPAPPAADPGARAAANAPSATRAAMTPPAPVPMPATPPATARPADEPGTLRLADLAPDERQQLPALKMSMHMWAPEAVQRFVILDGARMAEGDRIGDAVVQSITQDGAVLAWRGRRLKVPVR